jgi:hypothetical protein
MTPVNSSLYKTEHMCYIPIAMTYTLTPLYSRYFTTQEKRSLRYLPHNDLSSEIDLVRVLIGRFMEMDRSAPPGLASRVQALLTLVRLCTQLAVLVRQQLQVPAPLQEFQQAFWEAVEMEPFYITPDVESEENTCPKNAAPSPATATPTGTDSIHDTSPPLNSDLFPTFTPPT